MAVSFLAGDHAYEVSVQDVTLGWVTLQCLDQDVLLGATDVQFNHVAEGSLVFEQLGDFLGQHADGLRGFVATVDNSWNQAGETTQAAARTFPQVGTRFGIQVKSFMCFSKITTFAQRLRPAPRRYGQKSPGPTRVSGRGRFSSERCLRRAGPSAEHRADRFFVADATHRLGNNRSDIQLTDTPTGLCGCGQRDGVGHHQLVQHGLLDVSRSHDPIEPGGCNRRTPWPRHVLSRPWPHGTGCRRYRPCRRPGYRCDLRHHR